MVVKSLSSLLCLLTLKLKLSLSFRCIKNVIHSRPSGDKQILEVSTEYGGEMWREMVSCRRAAKDAESKLLPLSLSPGRKDVSIPPLHVLTGPQGAGCGEGSRSGQCWQGLLRIHR